MNSEEMVSMRWKGAALAIIFAAALATTASAQQLPQRAMHNSGAGNYDVARESVLQGKVLQYSSSSTTAPMGARISLQTSSGVINVHAGNPKVLDASRLSLQAGDSLTVTGENVAFGNTTIFVARLIQKGSQSVAVRSRNGMPLFPSARTVDGKIMTPAGAR